MVQARAVRTLPFFDLWRVIGVAIFEAILGAARFLWINAFEVLIAENLSAVVLQRLLEMPLQALLSVPRSRIVQALSVGARLRQIIFDDLLRLVFDALTIAVFAAALAAMHVWLAIAIVAIGALVCVIVNQRARMLAIEQANLMALRSVNSARLIDVFESIETVLLGGAARRMASAMANFSTRVIRGEARREYSFRNLKLGADFVRQFVSVIAVTWMCVAYRQGGWTIGQTVASLQMIGAILAGSLSVGLGLAMLGGLFQVVGRDCEVLDLRPAKGHEAEGAAEVCSGNIRLESVSFRYGESSRWVLDRVSDEIRIGERVRISGPSGVGKTTLLRIVAGIYRPTSGEVSVPRNGDDEPDCVMVGQDVRLVPGSIRDTLFWYSGGASDERLRRICRITGLDELLEHLPLGWHTRTGAAFGLSGGQRQLIALTGVLASKRRILLLDEPTANMDSGWSGRLEQALSSDARTLIYVSHDDNWLRAAGGRVIDLGISHTALREDAKRA